MNYHLQNEVSKANFNIFKRFYNWSPCGLLQDDIDEVCASFGGRFAWQTCAWNQKKNFYKESISITINFLTNQQDQQMHIAYLR